MSATSTPVLLAVGLGVGLVAFALLRRKRAQPTTGQSLTELCRAAGLPDAVCGVGGSIAGAVAGAVVGAVTSPNPTATNNGLNGAPEVYGDAVNQAAMVEAGHYVGDTYVKRHYRPLVVRGEKPVLRYANGCVPIEGAPGWEKCAPGTLDTRAEYPAHGQYRTSYLSGFASVDPLTFPTNASGSTKMARPTSDASQPQHWYWKGRRVTCPPGTSIYNMQDHRPGMDDASPCRAMPTGSAADDELDGQGYFPPRPPVDNPAPQSGPVSGANAGYVWVASPPPGRWQRRAA